MSFRSLSIPFVVGTVCMCASTAHAHFLWLIASNNASGQPIIQAHFSEAADDPEPELLKRLEGLQVWHRGADGNLRPLVVKQAAEAFESELPTGSEATQPGIIVTERNFGVTGRGDIKFLLQYYAKLYTGDVAAATKLGATERLRLDIVPLIEGRSLTLHVTWQGKPVADAEVVVKGKGLKGDKIKTDAKGLAKVELVEAGLLEIRARHIEAKGGEFEGKDYTEVRHYCTLTLPFAETSKTATTGK